MTVVVKRDERPPERVGPYLLVRRLGSGGAGQVWLGHKPTSGRASKLVALKLTPRHALGYGSRRRMFETEARMSATLNHSNIVQVFDVAEYDGRGVLVMEWINGLNLAEIVDRCRRAKQRLSLESATYIIGEILTGLAYAHGSVGRGSTDAIVHRDMSPQNVLVSVSGEVKVTDFGTARLTSEETSGLHVSGKLRYMAPEHFMGESRSPSVDLFGVGAIFHELLEGERFRAGTDSDSLLEKIKKGVASPLTREVPPELAQLRRTLLDPDKGRRIPSATAALDLLHRWPGFRDASDEIATLVERFVNGDGAGSDTRAKSESWDGPTDSASVLAAESSVEFEANSSTFRAQRPRVRRLLLVGGLSVSAVLGFLIARDKQPDNAAAHDLEPHGGESGADDAGVTNPMGVTGATIVMTLDPTPPLDTPTPDVPIAGEGASDDRGAESIAEPTVQRRVRARQKRARAVSDAAATGQPAHVKLLAHQYLYLEVQIDEQRARLDPADTITLPPGVHPVRFREPPGPWVDAGTIKVEAGFGYRVMFERPGKLIVVSAGLRPAH